MEIKPFEILLFIYNSDISIEFTQCTYTQATECKEELVEGILELTLRDEVNVKIMLIHYLKNA